MSVPYGTKKPNQSKRMSGKGNSMFGKHHSEKSKEKMSENRKNKGRGKHKLPMSDIGKKNISKNHADVSGEKNPNWNGGREAFHKRRNKITRSFGFIPLNDWFPGCEGHHIDKEFVIHIPKEMHKSIWHSVTKNINMDLINDLAIDFCYGD